MMPRPITPADRQLFAALHPREFTFTGPGEIEADVQPCQGLVTDDPDVGDFGCVVRVPWTLNDTERAQVAAGGTIWLSTWGGLPIHHLTVQP